MKIMAVDTEQSSLNHLLSLLREVCPDSEVAAFCNPMLAVKYGINQPLDLVFTEIPMRGVDGLTLTKLIREHRPEVRTVFVTGSDRYGVDAVRARADGYLIKPVTKEALRDALLPKKSE